MNDYITTEELKREIENLGFSVRVDYRLMQVTSSAGDTLAKISKIQTHALNVLYPEFITRTIPDVQENLYNLLDRYARTPLDKREEQKKYRLKLDISDEIVIFDDKYRYLAKSKQNNTYCLSLFVCGKTYQNTFTQAEIDEMGDLTKGFQVINLNTEGKDNDKTS